jgi:hypothetical protein
MLRPEVDSFRRCVVDRHPETIVVLALFPRGWQARYVRILAQRLNRAVRRTTRACWWLTVRARWRVLETSIRSPASAAKCRLTTT